MAALAKYPARRSAWVPGGKSHGSGARNLGRSPLLPPRALARLANEAQLRARIACLPGDLGPHRSSLTLLAALSTTPVQMRSFATVAAPAPLRRLERP